MREALEVVGLGGLEQRGATELSGGQQQRVALARAIVYTPTLLLLDEPLSNLDVKLREQMRSELHALHRRLNLAVVYVTHDQAEALALSDRIAVVNQGRLEQVGTPVEVYERPRTRFVGDFLGRTVIVKGTVRKDAGRKLGRRAGPGPRRRAARRHASAMASRCASSRGRKTSRFCRWARSVPIEVVGKIEHVAYMGDHLEYTIAAAGRTLVLPAAKKEALRGRRRCPARVRSRLRHDAAAMSRDRRPASARPTAGRLRGRGWRSLRMLLFFAVVMALPILFLLVGSFNTAPPGQAPSYGLENWMRAFSDPQTLSALWMSFLFSVVRLVPSLALSVTVAWLIARTDMPGGNMVEFLCWLAFFVPDFPLTLAWILLLDPNFGFLNSVGPSCRSWTARCSIRTASGASSGCISAPAGSGST